MKKLVIAALAIASMAACTKSNVQYEQPGEISLQPVAQKATKAAVDGTHYPTGTAYNFNVWAWWGDYEAATPLASFTTTTPYIAKGTFVHKETAWGGRLHTIGLQRAPLYSLAILLQVLLEHLTLTLKIKPLLPLIISSLTI